MNKRQIEACEYNMLSHCQGSFKAIIKHQGMFILTSV